MGGDHSWFLMRSDADSYFARLDKAASAAATAPLPFRVNQPPSQTAHLVRFVRWRLTGSGRKPMSNQKVLGNERRPFC